MQIPIVMLHTAGGDFFLHFLCILCVFATKINAFQKEKTEKSENLKKSASGGATGRVFFLVSDLPPACLAMFAEHKLLYVRPNQHDGWQVSMFARWLLGDIRIYR